MTRQEAHEQLLEFIKFHRIKNSPWSELDEAFKIALQVLESSDNKWVSVDEELPGDERVLFFAPPSGMLIGRLVDGIWWSSGISYKMSDVTHWQSLPQKPSSSEIPNNCDKEGGEL